MSTFCTLEAAKNRAGIPLTDTAADDDLQTILDAAEAHVLDYIGTDTPPPSQLVPFAILLQFVEWYRFAGDDPDGQVPKSERDGEPSPQVKRVLYRLRTQVVA